MKNAAIRLEKFSEIDFDTLIHWIKDEKELIRFAGPIFRFPISTEQLHHYTKDPKRHIFKIIHSATNQTIGHAELYQEDDRHSRLCRILIGDKNYRGKGYGTVLTKMLTIWAFENLETYSISLNVYDFNTFAIKAYENVGFKISKINEQTITVDNEIWTSYKMTIEKDDFDKIHDLER